MVQKSTQREEEHEDQASSDEDDQDASVQGSDDGDDDEQQDDESDQLLSEKPVKKRKIHKLSLTETENFNEKLKKRGVLYIARIPPRMTPTKVKALLSEFGEVTRVYLVEEDPTVRKRRRKEHGKSGGKRYNEGWVEMTSKRKAKHVAQSLNTTQISNQKRNPHYGDLWNLKYLPKFKWSHLTEKVAYERRVREQKLRVEMMQARRENASYVQMVETGKKLDKIEARKHKRGEDGPVVAGDERKQKRHKHKQKEPLRDGSDKSAKRALLGGML
jgi:ESF2/ABP1 family protein